MPLGSGQQRRQAEQASLDQHHPPFQEINVCLVLFTFVFKRSMAGLGIRNFLLQFVDILEKKNTVEDKLPSS